jgi:hypothetical protein
MTTPTNIKSTDTSLFIYRLIDNKYYRVEFGLSVLATELEPYFNLNDEHFKKLGMYYKRELS